MMAKQATQREAAPATTQSTTQIVEQTEKSQREKEDAQLEQVAYEAGVGHDLSGAADYLVSVRNANAPTAHRRPLKVRQACDSGEAIRCFRLAKKIDSSVGATYQYAVEKLT